jgi:hypothetical protein
MGEYGASGHNPESSAMGDLLVNLELTAVVRPPYVSRGRIQDRTSFLYEIRAAS